jgi:hypothetical protein
LAGVEFYPEPKLYLVKSELEFWGRLLPIEYSVYDEMTLSEKQVADYLHELGLWWRYESPVFLEDERRRPRVWTPDFYVPKLGMYVEVCGSESLREQYKYRERIYKENNYSVVFLHLYKEREKWKNFLLKRIVQLENSRHLEVMKILESRV